MEFIDDLQIVIKKWNSLPIEDEWLFENFRNKHISKMSCEDSFLAIEGALEFLLKEEDESTSCEILQTVINLANKSQTTEIPKFLLINRELLDRKFSLHGDYAHSKLKELYNYYRIW